MSRLAEKIHAAVRLDGRVELSATDALAARNALDALEAALEEARDALNGAPNTVGLHNQIAHALAKLEADNG